MQTFGRITRWIVFPVAVGLAGCAHSDSSSSAGPRSSEPLPALAATASSQSTPAATSPSATLIKSAPPSIDAILAGTKTSTTRKGIRSYPLGPTVTTDGHRRVDIEITSIEPKRVANLTAADAASDGSASIADYRKALLHSYPGLTDDDIVSVIHFRLATKKAD
jgi:hypothetical protein